MVVFDEKLIKKYDRPGPRYTSYPPATEFKESITYKDYERKLNELYRRRSLLSFYIHIPFCESACWFCGCNVMITKRRDISGRYLQYLFKELSLLEKYLGNELKIDQFHIGGGTPNFLTEEELRKLMEEFLKRFSFTEGAEISIELDPRFLTRDYVKTLKELGFNRISMGLQDINEEVQRAINRFQSKELMLKVMDWLREEGFNSINIDLIYGLPNQNPKNFKNTLEFTLKLSPERVAVFNFAYVPWLKPLQRKIDKNLLPKPEEKLKMLKSAVELFQEGGYVFIGMDHFAKPEDELTLAQRKGELWRNFQGYTTRKGVELLGVGATSIGTLKDSYFQNYKTLRHYYLAIDEGKLPTFRGYIMDEDDLIRREVIMDIMCNLGVDFKKVERAFSINFKDYFSRELEELEELERDGLVVLKEDRISITELGRLLVRNVAMVFDKYLRNKKELTFSRTV